MAIEIKVFVALTTMVQLASFGVIDANETINKPPYFLPGTGDFATFSLPENFEVGTSVYKLKGKALRLCISKLC